VRLDGRDAEVWAARVGAELREAPDVRVLERTTVTGAHDHGLYVAVQRLVEDPAAPAHLTRQRLWEIRARRVVLATGAYERPIVFPGNDRPGVMAAGAAAAYARAGALGGRRAVVFGTNDDALRSALALLDAGVEVAAVVDVRAGTGAPARRGVAVWAGCAVAGTEADGDGGLAAVRIAEVAPDGRVTGGAVRVECDLLAVSGGHDPAVELYTQAGGRTTWSPEAAALVPDTEWAPQGVAVVGAARGTRDLADALAEGAEAGMEAAAECGFACCSYVLPVTDSAPRAAVPAAFWFVDFGRTGTAATDPDTEAFVDLNRDATLADVRRALADGMRHVEHVKRYTTIGTGADQGRTSAVLLAGVLAGLTGTDIGARTTARPPVAPIRFALIAGRDRGALSDPARRTPMHDWHVAHGAEFEDVGQWKRAWYYPRDGEDTAGGAGNSAMAAAVRRECRAARESVAVLDYSTLGKIDLSGADTPAFLDRVYANRFATLKPGRCRYGVMCGPDGMVADDGVTARLSEDRFHMTTTTGNAAAVLGAIEEWLYTEWPDLDVHATSVTEQWAVISLVGPRARDVMRTLSPGADLDGFGFMTVREMPVAGVPARVFRVSFTGELTYEINVPWWYGAAVWRAVMAAGAPYGITPYGTETMHVLRAEKGLIVAGQETDGTVTPEDVGLGWAVSKVKDFVGKRSLARPDTARADRPRLVGLLPHDPGRRLSEGAQLVAGPDAVPPLLGHVTSAYDSAALGRTFALALLSGGADRQGATVYAVDGDAVIPVAVTDPVFYDRDNTRRDGRDAAGVSGGGVREVRP
jgi:sarcosine oxidase subunit alpha